MSIVVRNETGEPFFFGERSRKKQLQDGEVDVISPDELETVPFSKRGPGGINILWPDQVTSNTQKTHLEYYVFNSGHEIRYLGFAMQDAPEGDNVWIVKRFDHVALGGGPKNNRVSKIQVFTDVAWDDRATLPWT